MISILQKAFENAEVDAEKSKEITIQIECERMLKFWNSLLNDLPEQAHNEAEQKLGELSNALKKKDFTEIVKLKTILENIYGQYLDDIISARLSGKAISDIQEKQLCK